MQMERLEIAKLYNEKNETVIFLNGSTENHFCHTSWTKVTNRPVFETVL